MGPKNSNINKKKPKKARERTKVFTPLKFFEIFKKSLFSFGKAEGVSRVKSDKVGSFVLRDDNPVHVGDLYFRIR